VHVLETRISASFADFLGSPWVFPAASVVEEEDPQLDGFHEVPDLLALPECTTPSPGGGRGSSVVDHLRRVLFESR
jgi:hypothetical protein